MHQATSTMAEFRNCIPDLLEEQRSW